MKICSEIDLKRFEFWSGAKDTAKYLTDEELEKIDFHLEGIYPNGTDETTINDIFWFEDDFIAECLGYHDFEEIMEERS